MSITLLLTSRPYSSPLTEWTTPYKTYLKRALTHGLQIVFENHPDERLRYVPRMPGQIASAPGALPILKPVGGKQALGTKVSIEFPMTAAQYPSVVIRFYEREIKNIGVGHTEVLTTDGGTTFQQYKHYIYTGDIEFAVYALTSLDRDLIADTVVQTVTMGDLNGFTNNFIQQIWWPNVSIYPQGVFNYININTDVLRGFGETQVPSPWMNEGGRDLIYQVSYRTNIFGEFFNLPGVDLSYIKAVNLYPYIKDTEPLPTGSQDPSLWERVIP